MKWLKDIKANTRPWLAFLSGSAANTSDEPDDIALINQYFATYLQNMVADQLKSVSGNNNLSYKKHIDSCEMNAKLSETLRALSPLNQGA